jgi:uncharacterized PurR-regulated membrane protein YhhQ (DUF165 family)
MGSGSCTRVNHRALEGVLTYLNAFLILDLTRHLFKDQPWLAVIVIAICTIIVFAMMRARDAACARDSQVARESSVRDDR